MKNINQLVNDLCGKLPQPLNAFDTIGCYTGAYLKEHFFNFFTHPPVPFNLSIIILLLLIIIILYFHFITRDFSIELNKTQLFLREKTAGKNNFEKRKSFFNNYNDINDFLRQTVYLSHSWTEFKETLITPTPEDPIQNVRNSVNSENFFNEVSLFKEANIRSQIISFIPGFFISLGLLLTFIGLVAALMKTGEGFSDNPSTTDMLGTLRELINVATFKFITSIAGIGSASIFSFYSRKFIFSDLSKKIENICSTFEKSLLHQSIEQLTVKMLTENQQQTKVFDEFGERFAAALGDKLAPIKEELHNMAGQFGDMNQDALAKMTEDFQKNLTSNSQELIQNLTEKLLEVGERIGGLSTSMSSTGEEFNSQLTKATSNMVQSIEEINTKIVEQGDTFDQVANATKAAAESIDKSTTSFSEITAPLIEITSKIETALNQMGETTSQLSLIQEKMSEVVGSINTSTEKMQEAWATYQQRFEQVDEHFEKAITQFGQSMTSNQQNMRDFVKDIQNEFKSSLQTLSGAVSEISEAIEELKKTNQEENIQ